MNMEHDTCMEASVKQEPLDDSYGEAGVTFEQTSTEDSSSSFQHLHTVGKSGSQGDLRCGHDSDASRDSSMSSLSMALWIKSEPNFDGHENLGRNVESYEGVCDEIVHTGSLFCHESGYEIFKAEDSDDESRQEDDDEKVSPMGHEKNIARDEGLEPFSQGRLKEEAPSHQAEGDWLLQVKEEPVDESSEDVWGHSGSSVKQELCPDPVPQEDSEIFNSKKPQNYASGLRRSNRKRKSNLNMNFEYGGTISPEEGESEEVSVRNADLLQHGGDLLNSLTMEQIEGDLEKEFESRPQFEIYFDKAQESHAQKEVDPEWKHEHSMVAQFAIFDIEKSEMVGIKSVNPHQCHICSKQFQYEYHKKYHIQEHHPEVLELDKRKESIFPYETFCKDLKNRYEKPCFVCSWRVNYSHPYYLSNHMQLNHPEWLIDSQMMDMLLNSELNHAEGNKVWRCQICSERFDYPVELRYHLQKYHAEVLVESVPENHKGKFVSKICFDSNISTPQSSTPEIAVVSSHLKLAPQTDEFVVKYTVKDLLEMKNSLEKEKLGKEAAKIVKNNELNRPHLSSMVTCADSSHEDIEYESSDADDLLSKFPVKTSPPQKHGRPCKKHKKRNKICQTSSRGSSDSSGKMKRGSKSDICNEIDEKGSIEEHSKKTSSVQSVDDSSGDLLDNHDAVPDLDHIEDFHNGTNLLDSDLASDKSAKEKRRNKKVANGPTFSGPEQKTESFGIKDGDDDMMPGQIQESFSLEIENDDDDDDDDMLQGEIQENSSLGIKDVGEDENLQGQIPKSTSLRIKDDNEKLQGQIPGKSSHGIRDKVQKLPPVATALRNLQNKTGSKSCSSYRHLMVKVNPSGSQSEVKDDDKKRTLRPRRTLKPKKWPDMVPNILRKASSKSVTRKHSERNRGSEVDQDQTDRTDTEEASNAKKQKVAGVYCQCCGRMFKTFETFKQHQVSCLGTNTNSLDAVQNYKCRKCTRVFVDIAAVQLHEMLEHLDTKLMCPFCGKPFWYISVLRRHLLTHTKSAVKKALSSLGEVDKGGYSADVDTNLIGVLEDLGVHKAIDDVDNQDRVLELSVPLTPVVNLPKDNTSECPERSEFGEINYGVNYPLDRVLCTTDRSGSEGNGRVMPPHTSKDGSASLGGRDIRVKIESSDTDPTFCTPEITPSSSSAAAQTNPSLVAETPEKPASSAAVMARAQIGRFLASGTRIKSESKTTLVSCGQSGEKKYQCKICSAVFDTLPFLYQHQLTSHLEHVCKVCNKGFAYAGTLQKHALIHWKD